MTPPDSRGSRRSRRPAAGPAPETATARVAAIDIGSNSIHMIVAEGDGGGGYRGRTGIYELVSVDDTMRTMIHDGAGEHELERYARTLSPSIRDDGRAKVMSGNTSLEELLRVTRED